MKTTLLFFIFSRRAIHSRLTALFAFALVSCGAFAAEPTPAPVQSPIATPTEVLGGIGGRPAPKPVAMPDITASAGFSTTSSADVSVAAYAGKREVSVEEMRALLKTLDPVQQAAIAANSELLKRNIFTVLVEQEVMKEINAKHWDQQPDVQARLERVRQTALVEMYMKSITKAPEDYPSAADLKSAYEAQKDSMIVPHRFLIAQIFVSILPAANKADQEKAKAKLDGIVKKLQQPNADFAAIAHTDSDDAVSAGKNGEMGWIDDKKMPPVIHDQTLKLPKNGISQPFLMEDGWHILKILDSSDEAPIALDDVKANLSMQLRADKALANVREYVAALLKATPISINEEALPQLVKPVEK